MSETGHQLTRAAIVLGAGKFSKSPGLDRAGFSSSAEDFLSYLVEPKFFALPSANLLNLFDCELPPGDQLERLCDFLDAQMHEARGQTKDIVLYYVGHGGFVGTNKEYFLTIKSTKEGLEGSTGIRIGDLSACLRDHARRARKYLILDCCFAASAFSQFQNLGLSRVISKQTLEPLPSSGTALLCSSGSRQVSLAPSDRSLTMFSGALMEVLRIGEISEEAAFSLTEVGLRVKEILRSRHPEDWIRPEVHSPDMREGNIAHLPLFPNPGFSRDLSKIFTIGKHGWPSMDEYVRHLEALLDARATQLRRAVSTLERSYDITLEALGEALDLKDVENEGHTKRVTAFTIVIARAMGIASKEIRPIARGAFLHDIGKMGIPDTILRKASALTPEETLIMRGHSHRGYQMLRKIPFLSEAAEIVYSHHERYDGTGYPRALKGDEIPLGARLFSVADTLDAITSDRSYRAAQSVEVAREEIEKGSGLQFDPQVVKTFLSIKQKIWSELREEIASQLHRF